MEHMVSVARMVAPEDIRPGEYISVLSVFETHVGQVFDACADGGLRAVRIEDIPWFSGDPVLVEAVCLPFVMARDADGMRRPLDVRRMRLARVSEAYAQAAFARAPENEDAERAPASESDAGAFVMRSGEVWAGQSGGSRLPRSGSSSISPGCFSLAS